MTRRQGLGLLGAGFGLGFIIGPVIAFAVLAASDNNYSMVAYTAAVFSLISILLTVFWFKETLPVEKRGTATTKAGVGFGAMLAIYLLLSVTNLKDAGFWSSAA